MKSSIIHMGVFSAATNVVMLVLPLYMLQVYDRVLPAANLDTLAYLTLLALLSLLLFGAIEIVRGVYASRLAARLDVSLGSSSFLAAMRGPRAGLGDVQALRDLTTVRSFIASRTVYLLFDLPFGPIFIGLLYFVHPWLFLVTMAGAVLLLFVAVLNQAASSWASRQAAEFLGTSMNSAQAFARNFETVRALGMVSNAIEFWGTRFSDSLRATDKVARINAFYGGISRTARSVLQIAILGVGAYLVLHSEMTAGMIFASSMLSARALQPLDQIIGSWRQIIEAKGAWKRLSAFQSKSGKEGVALPSPDGILGAEQVIYYLPGSADGAPPLIKRLTFEVPAGQVVAVVGPSQAGKSTLARLLVGAIEPRSGAIRVDGGDIRNWNPEELGRQFGYLPQDVELFPGTIAQNISRFEPDACDEKLIQAAQRAHVHELILGQRDGYSTMIGPTGVRLSGGERQRIGLARAFYGDPKILVLDEPNANLDSSGEAALERAITEARVRSTTVLVITHRPSLAAICDRILMLRNGQIEIYGLTSDVLGRLAEQRGQTRASKVSPSHDNEGVVPFPSPARAEG
ncbi:MULTISPECIES: type I secretion system permease/ATPase [unclassified Mesorhizobium]|uniref:type I secretion system permease/ATPase n=1 Tax=unclassified Mesorhizobium TaxID=325217 RepID=UPI000FD8D917|nr:MULTISPECIES: type I secretion system permease/ATPase [unclassified Mesorhizobium]TGQ15958.1 type I secretion system permease/ATPase [Mesorhizobium sp. M2E.F.Ca.ET.219.01.1.1]TGT77946.1 type I secretion system permease/ATPase [Mesorhizobium sp. M2E.F.Ca.ET.166.01.1.1]TGW04056.1 type I secretion system permease/ATPase [Mesorhizobium sp. M2E.F.Ca.ET.154.01.1.1]